MAHQQQQQPAIEQQQQLIKQINTSNDSQAQDGLAIKREKSMSTLRKKQSQRFTVAHTSNPGSSEPVPPLPNPLNPPPHELRPPSISSTSDSDFSPLTQTHPSQSNYMPNPHASSFDPASIFGSQFSTGPPPISRTATNLSSVGSAAPSAIGSMNMNTTSTNQSAAPPEGDDDIIPTAIVIKNIPFSVRREQLLAIIEDLMIPLPYAFNYHFDNGVFRGLAFANFRSASEADAAVAGLNGFDISGRKLRVEYKKVLQAGEKERIEKEKAIKRMRSMQLQKESTLLDQYSAHSQPAMPSSSTHISFGNYTSHEDEYRGLGGMHNHQPMPSSIPHRPSQSVMNSNSTQHAFLSSNHELSSAQQAFESFSLSGALESKQSKELDMNDPQTLELYSRVVVFKEDKLRDELAFAKSLSGPQRRIVHQIAKKLGLVHRSEGVGEERFVVVSKLASGGAPRISRVASSANMGRAASGQQGAMGAGQGRYEGGLGTNSSALRMKKSMPDMRVREMNSGVFYPEPSPRDLLGRKSNINLRENLGSKHSPFSFQQPDEIHSVSIIPNHHHHHHQQQQQQLSSSSLSNNNPHQIIRQPKGPEGGAGKGFATSQLPSLRSPLHHQSSRTDLTSVFGTDDPCRPSENL